MVGYKAIETTHLNGSDRDKYACTNAHQNMFNPDFYKQVTVSLIVCLSTIGAALGTACVQVLDKVVPEFELNLWRFLAQWIITALLIVGGESELPEIMNNTDSWLYNLLGQTYLQ